VFSGNKESLLNNIGFVDLFRVLSSFKKFMEGSIQGTDAFRKEKSNARRIIQWKGIQK
jgi:hypothetical protein